MTIKEFKEALDKFPEDAKLVVGVSIPDLFINTVANGSITGNAVQPEQVTKVQLLAEVPSRQPNISFRQVDNADADNEGAVQEG